MNDRRGESWGSSRFYVWLSGWFSFVTWLLFVSRVSRGVFIYLYLRGAWQLWVGGGLWYAGYGVACWFLGWGVVYGLWYNWIWAPTRWSFLSSRGKTGYLRNCIAGLFVLFCVGYWCLRDCVSIESACRSTSRSTAVFGRSILPCSSVSRVWFFWTTARYSSIVCSMSLVSDSKR